MSNTNGAALEDHDLLEVKVRLALVTGRLDLLSADDWETGYVRDRLQRHVGTFTRHLKRWGLTESRLAVSRQKRLFDKLERQLAAQQRRRVAELQQKQNRHLRAARKHVKIGIGGIHDIFPTPKDMDRYQYAEPFYTATYGTENEFGIRKGFFDPLAQDERREEKLKIALQQFGESLVGALSQERASSKDVLADLDAIMDDFAGAPRRNESVEDRNKRLAKEVLLYGQLRQNLVGRQKQARQRVMQEEMTLQQAGGTNPRWLSRSKHAGIGIWSLLTLTIKGKAGLLFRPSQTHRAGNPAAPAHTP